MCGTLMQVGKDDLCNRLNLHGGRAWSGCCNTNSKEVEMVGWGTPKVLLQDSALHVSSLFPVLREWLLPSESSLCVQCSFNLWLTWWHCWQKGKFEPSAVVTFWWTTLLQDLIWGGQLISHRLPNSLQIEQCWLLRTWAGFKLLKHEGLHMPVCPLSH